MDKISTNLPDPSLLLQGMQESRAKNLSTTKSAKDTEKAASGFEALLLQQMMKSMWESVDSPGMFGENSNEGQIYRDMFIQAVADTAAKGRGMGVKDVVKRELLKHSKGI